MDNQTTPEQNLTKAEIELLTQSAESGNTEAQHQLGMVYASSNGNDLDYTSAFKWLKKASDSGHSQAMRTLSWLHANGFGTTQSDEKAQEYCVLLAEKGDPKDQYFLASLYQTGIYGMQPDPAKMVFWYNQAAQQHYPRAQYALAKLIIKGVDIAPNDEMAFQWLSLAVINGHKKADDELKALIERLPKETIDGFKQRMTQSIKASLEQ